MPGVNGQTCCQRELTMQKGQKKYHKQSPSGSRLQTKTINVTGLASFLACFTTQLGWIGSNGLDGRFQGGGDQVNDLRNTGLGGEQAQSSVADNIYNTFSFAILFRTPWLYRVQDILIGGTQSDFFTKKLIAYILNYDVVLTGPGIMLMPGIIMMPVRLMMGIMLRKKLMGMILELILLVVFLLVLALM